MATMMTMMMMMSIFEHFENVATSLGCIWHLRKLWASRAPRNLPSKEHEMLSKIMLSKTHSCYWYLAWLGARARCANLTANFPRSGKQSSSLAC
eukprot:10806658-Karenia_brevis.AAC.1